MKRWYSLLLPVLFSASFLGGYAAPQDRQYVDYFLRLQAAELFRSKSFLLNWSCAYVNQNRLLGVDLYFSCYRTLSINQARKMLVGVAEQIVDKINNDPALHERNLLPEPFSLNHVYLKIDTDNVFSAQADMETVQSMCLESGKITYYSYPASTLFYGRVTKFEETLEQARMLLGENVPFGGAYPVPIEAEKPVPEATPTPPEQKQPTVARVVEPAQEPSMTPITEGQRVVLDQENKLEAQQDDMPKKIDLGEENLLGLFFDEVADVFPDLRVDDADQENNVGRVTVASTAFPQAADNHGLQPQSAKDVCYAQEGDASEGQRWNEVSLPSSDPVLVAACQTEFDRPLQDAASIPYMSVAVSSTRLPEAADQDSQKTAALFWNETPDLPKHKGEILSNDIADENFTVGLVVEPPLTDEKEAVDTSPAEEEIETEVEVPTEASDELAPTSAFDMKEDGDEPAAEALENTSEEAWYKPLWDFFKAAPKEPVGEGQDGLSQPLQSGDTNVLPSSEPSPLHDVEIQEIPERASKGILPSAFGTTEEAGDAAEDEESQSPQREEPNSPGFFQGVVGWFHTAPAQASTDVDIAALSDPSTIPSLQPLQDEEASELKSQADVAQAPSVSEETLLASNSALSSEKQIDAEEEALPKKAVFAGLSNWLHVQQRAVSTAEEVAVSDTAATAEWVAPVSAQTNIGIAKGIVPPPELVDETQDDDALEDSSVAPLYQKVMGWIRVSNESFVQPSSEESIAQEEINDEEPLDEAKPWYTGVMGLFHGASHEGEIASVSPAEEGVLSAQQTTPDVAVDAQPSEGVQGGIKSWLFVPSRSQQQGAKTSEIALGESQESLDVMQDEGGVDEGASWVERFTDWVRGDHFEDQAVEESGVSESTFANASSRAAADDSSLVASRLGEVERPDETWEEIEDEMQDDDDADDETTKPGVMARAFSAIHSIWQSTIGESALSDKEKDLAESTASVAPEASGDDAEQPS